ncbi:MAG: MerR family transcriptional regulator [Glaciihabitans sp.]|nr:MerR family transcriptional regulator [Glaciihabitans sp.]
MDGGESRPTEWSIQEVARLAGTTSRTLRHYGALGVLPASRTGANGYRYYDAGALTRLQRILMLRELGLGLPAIAEVLAGQTDDARALAVHLQLLRQEKNRLDRQISSIETTLTRMEGGEQLMAEDMFDGFDHAAHRGEVIERGGADAYRAGDQWWRSMTAAEKTRWMSQQRQLAGDWTTAANEGGDPAGDGAQGLARRQFDWLSSIAGTPRDDSGALSREYFVGLGDLYVTDERFAANYGGTAGARFVRDAMRHFADHTLAG